MRVLLVGGTSSLAQTLIPLLRERYELLTAGRKGCDVELDLCSRDIQIPDGIECVVNVAAAFGSKEPTDILQATDVNVLGVMKLCHASSKAGAKHLVHISSIFSDLDSASPFFGAYSLSKRHSEDVAQFCGREFHLPVAVLKPSQIYGVGPGFRRHQPFLYTIMDKAQGHEDINLFGSNDPLRNFIHAQDVARIISAVIATKIEGTYPCVHPDNVTYSQIAAAAISAFASKSKVAFLKDKPDIPSNGFACDETLFRLLDYFPRISMEQGMRMEVAHRRQAS
ncbi:NAD(P)-dependent oxidoreductase [Bradyrhizobium sp. CB2312]|uniref:NAD-dependent epimerase/dehydratase family protein n=1 Tax=Bradyrhizobium sp. CB2312 TaxID=3039155 RepID=UPI0024B13CDD|nr:NAD(P)-dependent oxidoreductase [Bradyrhizobium sp. CB2312]WFU76000.1 NAD(P)-dependent oxidoreductase [Bradyrhizobium sp. CB2312]